MSTTVNETKVWPVLITGQPLYVRLLLVWQQHNRKESNRGCFKDVLRSSKFWRFIFMAFLENFRNILVRQF